MLKLPCPTNIIAVLDGFLRHYALTLTSRNPEKTRASQRTNSTSSNTSSNAGESITIATQMSLCKEVIDGIRVSFDFLLSGSLLYAEERLQYEQLKAKSELRTRGLPDHSPVTEQ